MEQVSFLFHCIGVKSGLEDWDISQNIRRHPLEDVNSSASFLEAEIFISSLCGTVLSCSHSVILKLTVNTEESN